MVALPTQGWADRTRDRSIEAATWAGLSCSKLRDHSSEDHYPKDAERSKTSVLRRSHFGKAHIGLNLNSVSLKITDLILE